MDQHLIFWYLSHMHKPLLTLYSIITPFEAFELQHIWKKKYGKWNVCSFGANANAPVSIISSKVFKTLLNFLDFYFNVF